MTDLRRKEIAIVGLGETASSEAIVAALKVENPNIIIVDTANGWNQATDAFKEATIETEKFNKAIAELQAIPALEFEKATMNKPFYYNVPKYRKKQRRW